MGFLIITRRPWELSKLPWWVAFTAAVIILSIVWVLRVNLSATHFPSAWNTDLFTYFYPMYSVLFESRGWGATLWNPYDGFGVPGLGMLQGAYLYPPHLLYHWIPTAACMELLMAFHMLLAAWFTALWCRAIGLGWYPGLVGGLVFSLTYMFSQQVTPTFSEVATWIPLGLYAIERYVTDRRLEHIPLLSLAIAMLFLAGGNQPAVYALLCFGIYTLLAILFLGSLRDKVITGLIMLLALILGLALAAPQLLPTIEASKLSNRPTDGLTAKEMLPIGQMFSNYPAIFRLLVIPPENPALGYIGATSVGLMSLAFISQYRRILTFAFVLVVIAILGLRSPEWFIALLVKLPVLSLFRFPARLALLLHVAVAAATALGTNVLLSRVKSPYAVRQLFEYGIVIVVWGFCAVLRFPGSLWTIPVTLVYLVLLTRIFKLEILLAVLLLPLIIFDLTGVTTNTIAMPWAADSPVRVVKFHSLSTRFGSDRVMPVNVWSKDVISGWHPKIGMLSGFFTPLNYDPLTPSITGDFLSFAATGKILDPASIFHFTGNIPSKDESKLIKSGRKYLSSTNVKYYLLRSDTDSALISELEFQGLKRVTPISDDLAEFVVLEDPAALPRAYGVYEARCTKNNIETLSQLATHDLNEVIFLREDHCSSHKPEPGLAAPTVSIELLKETQVILKASFEKSGYVYLADSYYPGWKAWVDGEETTILKANAIGRAVPVGAGKHLIEFRYRPITFYAGLLIAVFSASLLFLAGRMSSRAGKPQQLPDLRSRLE